MDQKSLPSYIEYLQIISQLKHQTYKQDIDYLVETNLKRSELINYGDNGVFVLDFPTKQYFFLSQNFGQISSFSRQEFFEAGLEFTVHHQHPQDRKIYSEEIFKREVVVRQSYSITQSQDCWYTRNYRFKRNDGTYIHVVQNYTYIQFDEQGNPLVIIGYVTDITPFKTDNRIVSIIKRWDHEIGFVPLSTDYYFPVPEESVLSKREIEIVKWILEGMNSVEIGNQLHISMHTVKTHRKNIMEKTNTKNSADLIRYCLQNKLI